jgi:hypothetical protein
VNAYVTDPGFLDKLALQPGQQIETLQRPAAIGDIGLGQQGAGNGGGGLLPLLQDLRKVRKGCLEVVACFAVGFRAEDAAGGGQRLGRGHYLFLKAVRKTIQCA